jgi:hypothetical protein
MAQAAQRYDTAKDLARKLGVTTQCVYRRTWAKDLQRVEPLPQPDVLMGDVKGYTPELVQQIVATFERGEPGRPPKNSTQR